MSNENDSPAIAVGQVDWGDLRRMQPLSEKWGFDRGQPVDRYYIENFLERQSASIRGRCIEIMNSDYIHRFGKDHVTQADALDVNPHNARANIIGDLTVPGVLEAGAYDCFVLTQTLPVIFDVAAVMRNCWAAIAPGGSLLVTAPCLCRYSPHPQDYWRLTDQSLTRLITSNTDCQDFEVEMHGNLVATVAFTMGMASAELSREELDFRDIRFPIVVAARLRKR